MSSGVWIPSEAVGVDKVTTKPHQLLNLYVHPEPSPELEERLLRGSSISSPLQHVHDRSAETTYQLNRRDDMEHCFGFSTVNTADNSVGGIQEDSLRAACVATTGPSGDGGSGVLTMQNSWQQSVPTNVTQDLSEQQSKAMKSVSLRSPRLSASEVAGELLARPDTQPSSATYFEHQQGLQYASSSDHPIAATPGSQLTPHALALGPTGCTDGTQAAAGRRRSFSAAQPGVTPAPAELMSVRSLSLSGADRDLFDQIFGEEVGASPQLVTPSSFLATGPFGDAAMQPALSDYSQRPTSAHHLADMFDAEADSGAKRNLISSAQPQLVSAYSEPLPFSAADPHRPALHPGRASAGMGGAACNAARSLSNKQPSGASIAAGSGQLGHGALPVQEGNQPCAGNDNSIGPAGTAAQELSGAPPHEARAAHRPPQSLRATDEPGLLAPAYSEPAAGALRYNPHHPQQPGAPPSSSGVAVPMQVDTPAYPSCYMPPSAAAGGITAPATETAPEPHRPPEASSGVPMQQSPPDSRGKRLRQVPCDKPAAADGAPSGQGGDHITAATGVAPRPGSPGVPSPSVGDPMSVSMDEDGPYGYGGGYPYPYGIPPPYGMPYGMPYGDPYYHMPAPYGYPSMTDGTMQPPPSGPDSLAPRYGGPHAAHSQASGVDHSAARMMHYPGYMAPRHRLYRRFVTGAHGRRDGYGSHLEPNPSGPGVESGGLISMASAPAGSISSSGGPSSGVVPLPSGPSATKGAGPTASCPPGVPRGSVSSVQTTARAMDDGPAGMAFAAAGHAPAPKAGSRRSTQDIVDSEMESTKAARACHEQFSADDMPLPLPRSTVDGIRQELRVVTQELLQRRMEEARKQTLVASSAAGPGAPGGLRPANSWAPGDGPTSVSFRSAPEAAAAAMAPQHPPHYKPQPAAMAPQQSGPEAAGKAAGPSRPPHPMSQSAQVQGSAPSMLPHKRSASTGPPASAGTSPVRHRPAPSAPAGVFGPGMTASGPQAGLSHGRYPESMPQEDQMAPSAPSGFNPSAAMRPGQTGGTVAPVAGSNAIRQLFPAPGAPCVSHAPPSDRCGSVPSQPVAGKPPAHGGGAATVSAPPGPRPAMSGKSAASATQSASVAQALPVRAARQQSGVAAPIGSYRIGQQGSMAAEAEDDGEEVHGPPQRSSSNRPAATVGASSGACAPPPQMPSSYYGAMPPPSYDYPPSYYYPPPLPGYGVRMYGMPQSGMPPPPAGYRGPPGSSAPMYSMPAPGMGYGMGQSPWQEYGIPQMPQPGPGNTAPGLAGTAQHERKRGGSTAGAYPGYEQAQPAAGKGQHDG